MPEKIIIVLDLDHTLFDSRSREGAAKILTGDWPDVLTQIKAVAQSAGIEVIFQVVSSKNRIDDMVLYVGTAMQQFFSVYLADKRVEACFNPQAKTCTISFRGTLFSTSTVNPAEDRVIEPNLASKFPSIHIVTTPEQGQIPPKAAMLRQIAAYHGVHDLADVIMIDDHQGLIESLKQQGFSTVSATGLCPLDTQEPIAIVQQRTTQTLFPSIRVTVAARVAAILQNRAQQAHTVDPALAPENPLNRVTALYFDTKQATHVAKAAAVADEQREGTSNSPTRKPTGSNLF